MEKKKWGERREGQELQLCFGLVHLAVIEKNKSLRLCHINVCIMYYNVEFKLQILQRNVGLKYIDLEQMHRK